MAVALLGTSNYAQHKVNSVFFDTHQNVFTPCLTCKIKAIKKRGIILGFFPLRQLLCSTTETTSFMAASSSAHIVATKCNEACFSNTLPLFLSVCLDKALPNGNISWQAIHLPQWGLHDEEKKICKKNLGINIKNLIKPSTNVNSKTITSQPLSSRVHMIELMQLV